MCVHVCARAVVLCGAVLVLRGAGAVLCGAVLLDTVRHSALSYTTCIAMRTGEVCVWTRAQTCTRHMSVYFLATFRGIPDGEPPMKKNRR